MKSLAEQIKCVKRELAMRERVYPLWVARDKMKLDKAEFEIECMRAVLATLEALPKEQGTLL